FDDVEIPADSLIGEEGAGFAYILDGMNAERILVGSESIGDGRWFVDKAVAYSSQRVVFGRPIGANQGVQFPIAKAHTAVEAAAAPPPIPPHRSRRRSRREICVRPPDHWIARRRPSGAARPLEERARERRARVWSRRRLEETMKLPDRVTICEVGTRDGFQIEPDFIPTELKVEVVTLLAEAGVPRIEVTSFVHPKVVPQLRDAEEVMAKIRRRPGTRYAALVPNDKGAVRAVDAGVDAIHTVVSASES